LAQNLKVFDNLGVRLLLLDRPIVALKIPVMILGKSFLLGQLLSLNPNNVCQKSLGTPSEIFFFLKTRNTDFSNPVARRMGQHNTLKDKHTGEELFIFTKPINRQIRRKIIISH
jgi:hypothetical protein